MGNLFKSTIDNNSEDVADTIEAVRKYLSPYELPLKVINAVNLVLEETILNIIRHGYEDDNTLQRIFLTVKMENDQVAIELVDDGNPFNPLSLERIDPTEDMVEEKRAEFGMHLVRNIMRSMAYRRENSQNIFEIWLGTK